MGGTSHAVMFYILEGSGEEEMAEEEMAKEELPRVGIQ